MQFKLVPHASAMPRDPMFEVWARIEAGTGSDLTETTIVYGVSAPAARFSIAAPSAPKRTDDLWQTTCFEAFVRGDSGRGYREWNFAPSGKWAAYDFAGYREAMKKADLVDAPEISFADHRRWWTVSATMAGSFNDWHQFALSCVLEERDNTLSYWALSHPLAHKADFHHPSSFRRRVEECVQSRGTYREAK